MTNITKPYPGITIYDNVFDWDTNKLLFLKCLKAPYIIGWEDSFIEKESFMHSPISSEMWIRKEEDQSLKDFLDPLANSIPFKNLKEENIDKTIVNCDTIADSHTQHIHKNQEVILYYANTEWKDGWGGETFFYDATGKDIVYTSSYTPNRMIHFDGEIVHRFASPTKIGPKYRFSISTFFWKTD